VACAEHLHRARATAPDKLVIYGGSAGGLLVGAAANLRPDLFAGVIGAVPFVDVLNTMSDVDLPLTPPEWPEWGDPTSDPAAYDYIASYSPTTTSRPVPYPAVLATGGLSDPRVTYWEPAKWVARLRAETTRRCAHPAQDEHGGRPRGRLGPLRLPQGDRPRLRFRRLGGGARLEALSVRQFETEGDGGGSWPHPRGGRREICARPGRRHLRPPPSMLARLRHLRVRAAERRRWPERLAGVQARGLPYLVAEVDGVVLGYAYASVFRPRAGLSLHRRGQRLYRAQRRGPRLGKALLARLIADCEALGLRQMVACIGDSGNAASIALHAALGFKQQGVFPAMGYKFGRWVDLVWMQRDLNGGGGREPDAPGLSLSGV
jgi:L-amino acid N-acyltransferase YncA